MPGCSGCNVTVLSCWIRGGGGAAGGQGRSAVQQSTKHAKLPGFYISPATPSQCKIASCLPEPGICVGCDPVRSRKITVGIEGGRERARRGWGGWSATPDDGFTLCVPAAVGTARWHHAQEERRCKELVDGELRFPPGIGGTAPQGGKDVLPSPAATEHGGNWAHNLPR